MCPFPAKLARWRRIRIRASVDDRAAEGAPAMDPGFLTIAELNQLKDQRELSRIEVTRSPFDRVATL